LGGHGCRRRTDPRSPAARDRRRAMSNGPNTTGPSARAGRAGRPGMALEAEWNMTLRPANDRRHSSVKSSPRFGTSSEDGVNRGGMTWQWIDGT
jgi:hypothetical protein